MAAAGTRTLVERASILILLFRHGGRQYVAANTSLSQESLEVLEEFGIP